MASGLLGRLERLLHPARAARAERLARLDAFAAARGFPAAPRFGGAGAPILVFLHIAKTAGSTFAPLFLAQFAPGQVFNANLGPSRSALGVFPVAPIEERLKAMTPEARAAIRATGGHLMFGIHRLLPGPARYLTVLRDPVERVISSYEYLRRTPGIPVRERILAEGLTLEGYARSGLGLDPHNYQTRILAGLEALDADWEHTREALARPMGREALELAKDNLERHFEVVGLTEAFDEFLALCALRLGWRASSLVYERRNVAPREPGGRELPAATLELIRQCNRLDQELYEHARALFERAAAPRREALAELAAQLREASGAA